MHPECETSVQITINTPVDEHWDIEKANRLLLEKYPQGVPQNKTFGTHVMGVDFFQEGNANEIVETSIKTLFHAGLLKDVEFNIELHLHKIKFDSMKEMVAFETTWPHIFPTIKRSIFLSTEKNTLLSLTEPLQAFDDFSLYFPKEPEGIYQAIMTYGIDQITKADPNVKSARARYEHKREKFYWRDGVINEWILRQAALDNDGDIMHKPKHKV